MNEIDMNAVAQNIVPHLGDWKAEPNDNTRVGVLQRPDGARIHLRLSNNGTRIEVYGFYPVGHIPYGPYHTISISPKRTPQDMAADIEWRFLPTYDKLYAEAWESAENERRRLQDKIETTQRLANLLGVAYRPPDDATAVPKLSWSEGEFHAYVRTENGRVYLDRVSMSLEQFEHMVAAIRDT
jgi:hypothetical protein